MKIDESNPQHAVTIARYLSGEMDKSELTDFEIQIASSEENQLLMMDMKKHWKALGNHQEPANPDTRKAWNKLHARLDEENLIPDQGTSGTRKIFVPGLLRIAALLIIVLGAGVIIYLSVNRLPKPQMVQIRNDSESNTMIKTLADGSVIYLAKNSTFSFPEEFETGSRNVELKGEAFFDIASDPAKPFIIETDNTKIQVLGTAFNVKTKNGSDFELVVDRGKVKVTMKAFPLQSEYVVAGEKVTARNNSFVKSPQGAADHNLWYTRRMQFKDEPLQNIISVLNRNFNTTFAVANREIGYRRIAVTFDNESAETMTELICLALNLKSQVKNDSIVLSDYKAGAKGN